MIRRLIQAALTLLLMLMVVPAMADDVCVIDAAAASGGTVSTSSSYIRVECREEGAWRLSITDAYGSVCYDRQWGTYAPFASEEIYLRADGVETAYHVTLSSDSSAYGFTLIRQLPRFEHVQACSSGYPLSGIADVSTWKTVTMVDTAALAGADMAVPMQAGGAYGIGRVLMHMENGRLQVSAWPLNGVTVHRGTVYVALDAASARDLAKGEVFSGMVGSLNETIALEGAPRVCVYVQLEVSFDPSGVQLGPELQLIDQENCWKQLQLSGSDAIG